ncbi:MAG: hypothetical protein ACFB9M_08305 [Myxococcota bacterium]
MEVTIEHRFQASCVAALLALGGAGCASTQESAGSERPALVEWQGATREAVPYHGQTEYFFSLHDEDTAPFVTVCTKSDFTGSRTGGAIGTGVVGLGGTRITTDDTCDFPDPAEQLRFICLKGFPSTAGCPLGRVSAMAELLAYYANLELQRQIEERGDVSEPLVLDMTRDEYKLRYLFMAPDSRTVASRIRRLEHLYEEPSPFRRPLPQAEPASDLK